MARSTGELLYFGGLAFAFLLALLPTLLGASGLILLVLLGLGVGYFNIKPSESVIAILVVMALPVVAQALTSIPVVDQWFGPILDNITAFAGDAAIPVVLGAIHRVYGKK